MVAAPLGSWFKNREEGGREAGAGGGMCKSETARQQASVVAREGRERGETLRATGRVHAHTRSGKKRIVHITKLLCLNALPSIALIGHISPKIVVGTPELWREQREGMGKGTQQSSTASYAQAEERG